MAADGDCLSRPLQRRMSQMHLAGIGKWLNLRRPAVPLSANSCRRCGHSERLPCRHCGRSSRAKYLSFAALQMAAVDLLLPSRTLAIVALTDLTAGPSSRGPRRQQKAKKQSCGSVVGKRQRGLLVPLQYALTSSSRLLNTTGAIKIESCPWPGATTIFTSTPLAARTSP